MSHGQLKLLLVLRLLLKVMAVDMATKYPSVFRGSQHSIPRDLQTAYSYSTYASDSKDYEDEDLEDIYSVSSFSKKGSRNTDFDYYSVDKSILRDRLNSLERRKKLEALVEELEKEVELQKRIDRILEGKDLLVETGHRLTSTTTAKPTTDLHPEASVKINRVLGSPASFKQIPPQRKNTYRTEDSYEQESYSDDYLTPEFIEKLKYAMDNCCSKDSVYGNKYKIVLVPLALLFLFLLGYYIFYNTIKALNQGRTTSTKRQLRDTEPATDLHTWVSFVDRMWEAQDGECVLQTLCAMNQLAAGHSSTAISLSSIPLSYLLQDFHHQGLGTFLNAATNGVYGRNCTAIYSNCTSI